MNRIMGAVKAAYYFFAGDLIILGGVVLAFIAGALLVHFGTANPISAVIFVALIVAALTTTLGRELRGRPRRA
ncbi:MAG: hypothetical protein ACHQ4H_00810 [Ktedonobacterales bacterium]|jgi:membrane protein implicated in regulation of membrane protease activity